jgi:hypothetical protein
MHLRRLVTAAALALAACYTESTSINCLTGNPPSGRCGGTPLTTVELTDSPFPYDSVARVDIYIVSIAVRNEPDTTNTGAGWITVAEPRQRFNLVALSGGVTDTLGGSVVPPGQYRAVRMVIDTDSSSVTAVTGQRMTVDWQSSAGRPALYALVEDPIGVPDAGTSVVIDFDVGRSFLVSRDAGCSGRCDGFVFSPVFRAVNRFATGAVSGVVTGDTLAAYSAPIGNVTITVYSGDPAWGLDEWWVRATGRTDATGHFRIAYLLPGTYILRADAPRASPFTPGVRSNVIVTAGTEVLNQGITLPRGTTGSIVVTPLPAYAYAGDSLILTASLVDSAGAVVPGATITWSNLDTAVADLWVFSSNRNRALFTAKVAGTARLFIAADGFGRTLTIPVLAAPATGVSWVQVAPDSAFIAVNDSVNFTATARDSAGIALPNQAYAWTSSDTTIANVRIYSVNGVIANIRGLRAGTTVIRATSGGKTGAATVRVQ